MGKIWQKRSLAESRTNSASRARRRIVRKGANRCKRNAVHCSRSTPLFAALRQLPP
jgi:hypothetical protein